MPRVYTVSKISKPADRLKMIIMISLHYLLLVQGVCSWWHFKRKVNQWKGSGIWRLWACARACVCVCVDAAAAGSHFTLTMWNQGFPFLTTSNIKATWARSHSMMRFLFHFSDLTSILKTCLKALQWKKKKIQSSSKSWRQCQWYFISVLQSKNSRFQWGDEWRI